MKKFDTKEAFLSEKDITNGGYITNELLPCPHCGNHNILTFGRVNETTGYIVYVAECINSECHSNVFCCLGGIETADEARKQVVNRWNKRIKSNDQSA